VIACATAVLRCSTRCSTVSHMFLRWAHTLLCSVLLLLLPAAAATTAAATASKSCDYIDFMLAIASLATFAIALSVALGMYCFGSIQREEQVCGYVSAQYSCDCCST
jgi:multidrug transporter EmrE-like cation transporter